MIKQDIHIYMLPIAGQTAGKNAWPEFFLDTQGLPGPGGVLGLKKFEIFFPNFFSHGPFG